MKKSELRKMIREEIKIIHEAIESDKDLENEIRTYMNNKKSLDKLKAEYEKVINDITQQQKSLDIMFKEIKKYMERFNISEKIIDNWIAKLEEKLKYKKITPDYKTLWEEAIKKVNAQTKKVLDQLMDANKELKKNEKKLELTIELSIKDIVKSIYEKIKGWFNSIVNYEKIAKSLPKI